ncbi:hypothetical protein [Lichenicoccus sp.]|uniref:hypothetical protein n=1 Tax=Lichenicoccus sp. TaxID=2781899 RepID=UPI003D100B01
MVGFVQASERGIAIGCGLALGFLASPVLAQTSGTGPFTLTAPAPSAQALSLTDSVAASSVQTIIPRLTTPEPRREVLHDPQTGSKTEEFGTAYSYANPLYGTNRVATDGVGGTGGGGAGVPNILSFVVARWGYPPKPLPRIAGLDTDPVPPDVPLIRYLMHAEIGRFPDQDDARVMDLVLHGMGRATTTQIDIMPVQLASDAAARAQLLRRIALALVHAGVHPAAILSGGVRVLPPGRTERGSPVPGHRISLVLGGGGAGG